MYKKTVLFLILGIFFFSHGCALSKVSVVFTAEKANFPVSLTEGFYDTEYNLILKEKYKVVHHFKFTYKKFSFSFLQFSSPKSIDLSNRLREILKAHNGDAIVNLTIKGDSSSLNDFVLAPLNWILAIPTFGLFVPSQMEAEVQGDVVKLLESKSSLFKNNSIRGLFTIVLSDGKKFYLAHKR